MSQTQAEPPKAAPPKAAKPRQGRSPGFPFIPLGKAIERAELFRVAEGGRPKHFAPLGSLAKAWGMGSKTGPFLQTVAAMGHYELMDFQGSGENRTARLTEMALNILLDKQPISPERDDLIRKAALAPKIHNELWQKWKDALPSNSTLETYLIRDREFTEGGAKDLIEEYKATISFAKVEQPVTITRVDELPDAKNPENLPLIEVGDFVQAKVNGSVQFVTPKRVRAIQEHDGQSWIFLDGEKAGVLMSQATLETKGTQGALVPPVLPLPEDERIEQRVLAGEREWLRGPLAKDVNYRLIVSGDIGPREIGKLIKLLAAQKDVLSDEDEDA